MNKYYYDDGTASSKRDHSKILHREDGPAVDSSGSKFWYLNGYPHRKDGPAVEEYDGYKAWYINGVRHRDDGPAIERADGEEVWFIKGKLINTLTKNQLIKYMKLSNLTPAHLLTDDDKMIRTSAAKYKWK